MRPKGPQWRDETSQNVEYNAFGYNKNVQSVGMQFPSLHKYLFGILDFAFDTENAKTLYIVIKVLGNLKCTVISLNVF